LGNHWNIFGNHLNTVENHLNTVENHLNTVENHLEYSLQEMLHIMQNDISVDGIYNIIYSYQKRVLVCRQCRGYSHSPKLFLHKNADTMLISSGDSSCAPLQGGLVFRYLKWGFSNFLDDYLKNSK